MNKILYALLIALEVSIIKNLEVRIYNQHQQGNKQDDSSSSTILNHWITTNYVRQISFSNYQWGVRIKNTKKQNPGPNFYTDSPSNVFLDKNGYLNMKITKNNNNWLCSEIGLPKSLGYGSYLFTVDKGFQKLDPMSVLGLFVWQNDKNQIDIQISKWGNSWSNSTQYAVQPVRIKGNLERFSPKQSNISVVHVFTWTSKYIYFQSFSANSIKDVQKQIGKQSNSLNLIHQWEYTGDNNPKPGKQKLFVVFYLSAGRAPTNGLQQQVVLKEFKFIPAKQEFNMKLVLGLLIIFFIFTYD